METPREVRDFLDSRPELESAIRELLDANEPFEFHDLDIDSGRFGEIVSAGIVERAKGEEGYVLVDRDAVKRGLSGNIKAESGSDDFEFTLSRIEYQAMAYLGVLIVFMVVMRTVFSASSVFQNGAVVLSANDPYYYRYWVEQMLVDPEVTFSTIPGGIAKGEPLYVVTIWAVTVLLGGTTKVAGWVLAWYPVISAVITGLLLYVLTFKITEDRRVALGSVLILAILPGHAFRTSLGFADHHAFDYPWLALTALSLVYLQFNQLKSKKIIFGILGLGVGVGGQTLAWEAGPLLTIPVGVAVVVSSLFWIRDDQSPLRNGVPMITGLAIAVLLSWIGHTSFGWHTTIVAISPLLLTVGTIGVIGVAELAYRINLGLRIAIIVELGAGLIGIPAVAFLLPEFWATATSRVTNTLFRSDGIAETQSLFGESVAWLLLFGFILLLALPYLGWATYKLRNDVRWTIPVVYGWAFLVLSVIQIRFVGQFSIFTAFFAGIGLVHLSERVDAARPPRPFDDTVDGDVIHVPDRKTLGVLLGVFLLVGSLSIVQVPIKTSQLTISEEEYQAAAWIDEYSEEQGLDYPENYVMSQWGRTRMYNYFVNGESRSYGYARQHYGDFVGLTPSQELYDRYHNRVGFLVTSDLQPGMEVPPNSNYVKLHRENAANLQHFELVHASNDGSVKVFRLVSNNTTTSA